MIIRIWHGRNRHHSAHAYEELLREGIYVGIAARNIRGSRGIKLLRRKLESKVEFITIMSPPGGPWFSSVLWSASRSLHSSGQALQPGPAA